MLCNRFKIQQQQLTQAKLKFLTSLAVIAILAQYFWRHIVGGTTGSVQQLGTRAAVTIGITDVQCTKTKVRDLQVAVGVQEKVLQRKRR